MGLYVAFLLASVPLLAFWYISKHVPMGNYRNTILNPFLFMFFYVMLVQLDFLSVFLTGQGELARQAVAPSSDASLGEALLQFNIALFFLAVGAYFGGMSAVRVSSILPSRIYDVRMFPSAILFAAAVIVFSIPLVSSFSADSLFSTAVNYHTTVQLLGAERFALTIALLPLFILFLAKRNLYLSIFILLIFIAILFLTGSRTRLIYAIIPFIFYLQFFHNISIHRRYFLFLLALFLTATFLLLDIRINLRDIESGDALIFENVKLDILFNSPDFTMSEVAILLYEQPRSLLQFPLENFVGALLAPIPREFLPFKPFPGSVQFTMEYDRLNWELYGRGLTMGSVQEFIGDYGIVLACPIIATLGFLWARLFCIFSCRQDVLGFIWPACLYCALFVFLRSDLQSVGQLLWFNIACFFVLTRVVLWRRSNPPAAAGQPV